MRTLLDTFETATATGSHICFVHKPLDLRLSDFQALCPAGKLPPDILKLTLTHLLLALDYLHTKCHLIHTGEILSRNTIPRPQDMMLLFSVHVSEFCLRYSSEKYSPTH